MARCEPLDLSLLPIYATTIGADVQGDRIEATIVGWSVDEEAFVLDHVILPGDTAQQQVWDDFDALLQDVKPDSVAVDSGFNATQVYAFCAKRKFCRAIKGVGGFSRPLVEDEKKRMMRARAAKKRGGYPVEAIGVDGGKVLVYSRLRLSKPGAGHVHFTDAGPCDVEYFAQLTAEKLITKYRLGRATQEWVKTRQRNETLDCFLYALAALRLANLDLEAIKAKREKAKANAALPAARPQQQNNDGFGREGWNL
jgi:phage terminase large subunit GpA-like protein